ncbi:Na+/H+ antiporter NhaC family protein [uncultured Clostridium sp.]|uniref:Na+/H+ antiporter NhaC family protein n=1 Tax=uncultured Clostridium sp. TaxID=59620 RepID=UPI0028E38C13|nr:Na+/H+ antiporter NhaC family protein [uncultured Clostridium sp.]
MEMYLGLITSFCLLIFGVFKNLSIGYMLLICWGIFVVICLRRGFTIKNIFKISFMGAKESFIVLKTLILIGALTATWLSCGTIPAIVYYCTNLIKPNTFILSVFLVCSITSFLIGSSLGTASIVGIPLLIIAKSGNVNLNMVAGAVIAGAYFGDRCSPVSSSAALVVALTNTNLFTNIKNMLKTSIIPFLLAIVFYFSLSIYEPLNIFNNNLANELLNEFHIQPIMLMPAIIIVVLSIFKVKINVSIPFSIFSAVFLSIFLQKYQLSEIIYHIFFGFKLESGNSLQNIIKGGGILSMLKTCLLTIVSFSLSSLFEEIKIYDGMKRILLKRQLGEHELFGLTSIVSILTGAFSCNQPTSTVMTCKIMKDCYSENKVEADKLALDLENSAILLSALIPWSVTPLVVTSSMNIDMSGFIPYGFYLYILPLTHFIYLRYFSRSNKLQLSA